jgi:DNA-directed RNA polymerase subunit RPC12/RpoP
MLLAERGLVRASTVAEREAAQAEQREWACVNCGASVAGQASACAYCTTPVLLYDLPRLADSLRPHAAYREAVDAGRTDAWPCHACGQVLDPTRDALCRQCGHPVLALVAAELRPVLACLAEEWQEWRRTRHAVPRAADEVGSAPRLPSAVERRVAQLMQPQARAYPRGVLALCTLVVVVLVLSLWSTWR